MWMRQVLSVTPLTPIPQGWGVWSALWAAGSAGRTPAALGKQLNPCPESVLPLPRWYPRWYPRWASLLQEAPERLWVPWSLESGNLRNVTRGVVCRESSPAMLRHPVWGKAASPCTKDPEAPGAVAARSTVSELQPSVWQEQAGPEQGY